MCAHIYYRKPFLTPYEQNHINNVSLTDNSRFYHTNYVILQMSYWEKLYYIFGSIISIILIMAIIIDITSKK